MAVAFWAGQDSKKTLHPCGENQDSGSGVPIRQVGIILRPQYLPKVP
jgi:hypothetical protein